MIGLRRIFPPDDPPKGPWIPLQGEIVHATFRRRVNRFVAEVDLDGSPTRVHVPNSGRLKELAFPGNRVILRSVASPARKTRHDWIMAKTSGGWALVDSRMGGTVFARSLQEGRLQEFADAVAVHRERKLGNSRLDFFVEFSGRPDCWIEVKSITLTASVPWGFEARFPDAPTGRGRRHLGELLRARGMGYRAAVLFAVGRPEATSVAGNAEVDPEFAAMLWEAVAAGVEVYAYRIDCSPELGYRLGPGLQVHLGNLAR